MGRNHCGMEIKERSTKTGHVPSGLICHPDREYLIYPLGCTIIIQGINNHTQNFLHGHTNNVSCVTVSSSGSYVASGQITFMGFKADIILWDYTKREMLARLCLHKGKIENLAFSPNDLYLVSLGGQDDGSMVVWSVLKKEAICGSPASARSAGNPTTLVYSNCRDEMFVSAGNGTIRVWELDLPNRKIRPTECQTGQLKRIGNCAMMTEDDSYFYIGTSTGDVLKLNTKSTLMSDYGPIKEKFSLV
uniref:Cilia- and flagella-associated protein 52 n=1 Tax=Sphaerodactylus townsendi TaxID=933632 RepID=A0ACB8EJZ5_9SAUR